mgnify:CR=1 FL=1
MKMRNPRGITLVTLVVTIIVLIILAGVSINMVVGDNGIITQAQRAAKETANATVASEEQINALIEELNKKLPEDKPDEPTEEEPVFTTVTNPPDIEGFNKTNTYYVAWNIESSPYEINNTIPISENPPSNWYDYTEGINHWANIKTTGGGNDCYWVWIPRYAYKVPTRSSTAQTIEIKFLEGTSNVPIGETEAITNTTPTPGTWVVHPAFTNSGNGGFGEIEGIWVAKFEASSSQVSEATVTTNLTTTGGGNTTSLQVRVIPNVTSWRGITVGNIFTVCRNLTTDGNSVEGATNVDSHMMKNTEWGACAYLSRSVYGKNGAVWNNPYYNNTTNYSTITGLCGTSQDASTTDVNHIYKYNTEVGINASTTGNVYGIFDMAGGSWEYVAAVLSSDLSNGSYYNFSTVDKKYYDVYTGYNNSKYGDSIYETSLEDSGRTSWDGDSSDFPNSDLGIPVFVRGGSAASGNAAGIFTFRYHTGDASQQNSFHPCLVNLNK